MKKQKKRKKITFAHFSAVRLLIFLIVTVLVLSVGLTFKTEIEDFVNTRDNSLSDTSTIDDNGLTIHFIDVGQGDSTAIRFPDGKTMLVDAGTVDSRNDLINYLKTKFFNQNEKVFDYVLLTHSDADHCGGMPDICNNFVLETIYRPKIYSVYGSFDETKGDTTKNTCESMIYYKTVNAFDNEISSNGEKAKIVMTDTEVANTTDKIEGENYSIDFFTPNKSDITKSTTKNDFSPIIVLNFKDRKIMLTGDASSTSESKAMKKYELPDVDILKVGHHGSSTSTSEKFLKQIKPEISIISVGANNTYKHPTTDLLQRLEYAQSEVYRTDKNGTIIVNIESTKTNIIIYVLGKPNLIKIEYLISGIIILTATLCFGKKIKFV